MKNYGISALVALVVSLGVFFAVPQFTDFGKSVKIEHVSGTPAQGALYTADENGNMIPVDFTQLAEKAMDAVVHIKSTQIQQYTNSNNSYQYRELPDPFKEFFGGDDFFEQFFGPRRYYQTPQPREPQARVGTGSGVIINSEGYIVTNNHVIANADDIEVTLHDNRTFKANVVGTDPSTDLALLQIKASGLSTLPLVNSDDVKVGEWVLAVGNPFNLNSTVTAGIVSAKSRNINILREKFAVESFIQTDAAINPGNSGGALINLSGGLIGINTAIASPTGAYAGYGFAVPSNIVNKVVEDFLKYGMVQRGFLGITIRGVDATLIKEKELEVETGVYVDSLGQNSAAKEAGIKEGDVIVEIDGKKVNTTSELQEVVASHRPGDKLEVKVNRKGKEVVSQVVLRNREGETDFLDKARTTIFNNLGAQFEDLDKKTAKKLNIDGGVKVSKLFAGKLKRNTAIKEGFIITKIDGRVIKSVDDLETALKDKKGGVLIEGVYEDFPGTHYYALGL